MAKPSDTYSEQETQRRFQAALLGARIVGHKLQSEMKLGKPRAKPGKSLRKQKPGEKSGG